MVNAHLFSMMPIKIKISIVSFFCDPILCILLILLKDVLASACFEDTLIYCPRCPQTIQVATWNIKVFLKILYQNYWKNQTAFNIDIADDITWATCNWIKSKVTCKVSRKVNEPECAMKPWKLWGFGSSF